MVWIGLGTHIIGEIVCCIELGFVGEVVVVSVLDSLELNLSGSIFVLYSDPQESGNIGGDSYDSIRTIEDTDGEWGFFLDGDRFGYIHC